MIVPSKYFNFVFDLFIVCFIPVRLETKNLQSNKISLQIFFANFDGADIQRVIHVSWYVSVNIAQ